MAPSATLNADAVASSCGVQPSSVLPSKSGTKPASSSPAVAGGHTRTAMRTNAATSEKMIRGMPDILTTPFADAEQSLHWRGSDTAMAKNDRSISQQQQQPKTP